MRRIVLSSGAVTTLAGSGAANSTDSAGTAAAFSAPMYVALDGLGNMYVTVWTHSIRKVVLATQAVTTVAGTGTAGFADGAGVAAAFNLPQGIACDANGNAYVADALNNRIRKMVLSSAIVTTLAGSANASAANGVGTSAGFYAPNNVVVDSSGTMLFVTDYGNHLIRQILIATQTVTTLAGSGTAGAANGVGAGAQFNTPMGLALDARGNLFVGDLGNSLIRQIVIATQRVTTIAGSGAAAWVDGFGTNAAFNNPTGLAVDARGTMLVADYSNHRLRVLQPTVPCPAGYYCAAGADRVACPTCALGASAAPLRATVTRTTAAWTIGENNAGIVNYKCVTQALGVSASLAFSAISVRVARGVFTAAAYASSAQPSGSQQGVWLYQGCFIDSGVARLLPAQLATALGPTDASLSCMALARAAGYSVVGFEAWAPPNGECWGLPPDAISNWRTAAVNEANCGEGAAELPHGLRWGVANWGIAIYQFNIPVQPVYAQKYSIMSPGYQSAYPSDHFTWDIVFPSPTTVSVCATAFNRINGWGDTNLKGLISRIYAAF